MKAEDLTQTPCLVWAGGDLHLVRGKDELLGGYDAPYWSKDRSVWVGWRLNENERVRLFDLAVGDEPPPGCTLPAGYEGPLRVVYHFHKTPFLLWCRGDLHCVVGSSSTDGRVIAYSYRGSTRYDVGVVGFWTRTSLFPADPVKVFDPLTDTLPEGCEEPMGLKPTNWPQTGTPVETEEAEAPGIRANTTKEIVERFWRDYADSLWTWLLRARADSNRGAPLAVRLAAVRKAMLRHTDKLPATLAERADLLSLDQLVGVVFMGLGDELLEKLDAEARAAKPKTCPLENLSLPALVLHGDEGDRVCVIVGQEPFDRRRYIGGRWLADAEAPRWAFCRLRGEVEVVKITHADQLPDGIRFPDDYAGLFNNLEGWKD